MRTPLLLAVLAALFLGSVAAAADDPLWVFVGTYTGKKSRGIYRVEFDPASGKLGTPELAAEVASPSFLAVAPDHKHLFCVCEIDDFKGKKAGGVASFALDAPTGKLKPINQESSVGPGPPNPGRAPRGRPAEGGCAWRRGGWAGEVSV
jgi:6-phosphogluconolactonase